MKPRPRTSAWTMPLWLVLAHCAEPLSAPSAFSDERYLCDAEHEALFLRIMANCRQANERDGSCSGLVSFRGTIDSNAVVVDSPVSRTLMQDQRREGGLVTRSLMVWASAPYFDVRLLFVDSSAPGSGSIGGVGSASNSDYIDIAARGGNYLSTWINETRDVRLVSPTEVRFGFSTELSKGGTLEGCLDVLSTPEP